MSNELKIAEDSRDAQPEFPRPDRIPDELWMLWEVNSGCWVVTVDDAPNGETYLVAFSESEAQAAARHQDETYQLDCVPVQVKGGPNASEK